MTKPIACIIGYGRFGRVLEEVLKQGFEVLIAEDTSSENIIKAQFVFPCVPISAFESVITQIANKLKPGQVVVDVCSVKIHPMMVMSNILPDEVDAILTHPLFGPDSYKNPHARKIMMHPMRDQHKQYAFLKSYFEQHKFEIIEITAENHDKQAANSQAVTHFLGRAFEQAHLEPTKQITTLGFEKLLEVKEQTCHDSGQLFEDMVKFNPFAKDAIDRVKRAISKF